MRKRIHGKQSVPANILYSPERAMKLPTHVPVFPRCTEQLTIAADTKSRPCRDIQLKADSHPNSRATQLLDGTCHSRTLYTSKALDQSNFIF